MDIMPGENCSVFGCGTCRRSKGIGIWKLPAPRNAEYKKWREDWLKINKLLYVRYFNHIAFILIFVHKIIINEQYLICLFNMLQVVATKLIFCNKLLIDKLWQALNSNYICLSCSLLALQISFRSVFVFICLH